MPVGLSVSTEPVGLPVSTATMIFHCVTVSIFRIEIHHDTIGVQLLTSSKRAVTCKYPGILQTLHGRSFYINLCNKYSIGAKKDIDMRR